MVLTKRIAVFGNEIDASRTSGTSRQLMVVYEHLFIDKPMVVTEPTVPSARLLGLDSKMYPSNMKRVLNKDLSRFSIHAVFFGYSKIE